MPLARSTPLGARFVAAVIALAISSQAAAAVVYTVDSVLDQVDDNPGDLDCRTLSFTCTLRAAIMEANKVFSADVIIELPAGVYVLTIPPGLGNLDDSGDLSFNPPASANPLITVNGAGAATTIIDAAQSDRILRVGRSRSVLLHGITFRNGRTSSTDNAGGTGGAIQNLGTLTVDACAFNNNVTVLTQGGSVTTGGAIYNDGTLKAFRSTFHGNTSSGSGGGIMNTSGGQSDVRQSTFSANSAYSGGGIFSAGAMLVSNSTLSGNSARYHGGGIFNGGAGNLNLYDSTIVGNQADSDANGIGTGGGLSNSATLNVRNVLVAFNVRKLPGGAVSEDCVGPIGAYGNNNFGGVPPACTLTQVGVGAVGQANFSYEIGPLQDNGGLTFTHALIPPTAMIDGSEPTVGCIQGDGQTLVEDQRGYARSAGARCDIGAFEYGAASRNLFVCGRLRVAALSGPRDQSGLERGPAERGQGESPPISRTVR